MKYAFFKDDSGAVTVDWVVMTAALVGLGLAVSAVVSSGVENISGDIDGELKRNDIIKASFTSTTSLAHLLNENALDPSAYVIFTTPELVTANRATFDGLSDEALINSINSLSDQGLAALALVNDPNVDNSNGVNQNTYDFASDNVKIAREIAVERGILE